MAFPIVVFTILTLIVVFMTYVLKDNTKNVQTQVETLNKFYDKLILLGYVRNNDELNYVGFNNNTEEMTIKTKDKSKYTIKYDDIIGAELVENNEVVMNIGSIVGGAILANSTGAIIGAMNKKNKVTSRAIKLNLDSFQNTTYWIDLLDNGVYVDFIPNVISDTNAIIDTINYILRNK